MSPGYKSCSLNNFSVDYVWNHRINMIQELRLQNLAEKLKKNVWMTAHSTSCIQYGWDLNSGAWSLFQSNIKRDLYIKKSFWLGLIHLHMVEISVCTALVCGSWMGGGGGIPLHVCFCESTSPPGVKAQMENRTQSISNVCRPTLIVWYYNEDWIRRVGVWVNSSGRSEWAQNANPMPPHFHLHQESNICTAHARHIPCFSKPWQLCKTFKTEMKLYPKDFCWVSKLRSIKNK